MCEWGTGPLVELSRWHLGASTQWWGLFGQFWMTLRWDVQGRCRESAELFEAILQSPNIGTLRGQIDSWSNPRKLLSSSIPLPGGDSAEEEVCREIVCVALVDSQDWPFVFSSVVEALLEGFLRENTLALHCGQSPLASVWIQPHYRLKKRIITKSHLNGH